MKRIRRHRVKSVCTLGALLGLSAVLGACIPHTTEVTTSSIDYRHRHPIAVTEADRSIVVFVGHARGGLSGSQRTDVMELAQSWMREGTGGIVAEVPTDTPNARAAAVSFRDIQTVLMASPVLGVTATAALMFALRGEVGIRRGKKVTGLFAFVTIFFPSALILCIFVVFYAVYVQLSGFGPDEMKIALGGIETFFGVFIGAISDTLFGSKAHKADTPASRRKG